MRPWAGEPFCPWRTPGWRVPGPLWGVLAGCHRTGTLAGGPVGSGPLTTHFSRHVSWMWLSSRPGVLQGAALPKPQRASNVIVLASC